MAQLEGRFWSPILLSRGRPRWDNRGYGFTRSGGVQNHEETDFDQSRRYLPRSECVGILRLPEMERRERLRP